MLYAVCSNVYVQFSISSRDMRILCQPMALAYCM